MTARQSQEEVNAAAELLSRSGWTMATRWDGSEVWRRADEEARILPGKLGLTCSAMSPGEARAFATLAERDRSTDFDIAYARGMEAWRRLQRYGWHFGPGEQQVSRLHSAVCVDVSEGVVTVVHGKVGDEEMRQLRIFANPWGDQ